MTWTVPAGTVVDTTDDPSWTPMTITAHLADPVVGLDTNPLHLDGPLSWCAFLASEEQGATPTPITDEWAPDFALPLATWTAPPPASMDPRCYAADGDHVWGWACSAAHYDVDRHTAVQIRKRPATDELARFTTDRRFHAGLGPTKAKNLTMPATVARTITWWALGDPDKVGGLLSRLTHLGRVVRHGHGRITKITVETGGDRDRWRAREIPWPDGRPGALRAPYWHHSRTTSVGWGPSCR